MNPVKLMVPFEILAGIFIALLTAVIMLLGSVLALGTAKRYLRIKSM